MVENSHQLVSMDAEGIVKITDTRRFNVLSSFALEDQRGSRGRVEQPYSTFIVMDNPLKLAFGGRSIAVFEYNRNYSPQAADENISICC